jgi:hypothetical protein
VPFSPTTPATSGSQAAAAPTIQGQPLNPAQKTQAGILLGECKALNAPLVCQEAIICAAIGESTLTAIQTPNSYGYWGVLQGGSGSHGSAANFPPPNGWNDSVGMAQAFLRGGKGFGNGHSNGNAGNPASGRGAIALVAAGWTDPGEIATALEDSGRLASYYGKNLADAQSIIRAIGTAVVPGGIAGLGGTGTALNSTGQTPFTVGNTTTPTEDYWTAANRLAQARLWYLFSDGETVYLADGTDLMQQTPAVYVDSIADRSRINHLAFTWDNCVICTTPIPTPDGWTTMGELDVGDYVLGSTARPTKIVGVSPVHRDHACYSVQFSDRTAITSDGGHLWKTQRGVCTTDAIRSDLGAGIQHWINVTEPVQLNRQVVAVTPVRSEPVRCIAVDAADHLYLAGEGMVPTHNTAFQYASNHKRHKKIQRRSTLSKVMSPVEAQLNLICAIDEVRAGDIVFMSSCGPGDGKWLVGECRRSVFSTYSEITLVPALSPLSEQQAAGVGAGLTGAAASAAGSGTVAAAMIAAAATIANPVSGQFYFEQGGGHLQAGTPDKGVPGGIHQNGYGQAGYDSTGAVAAVLAAGGLWVGGQSVPSSNHTVDTLLRHGSVVGGSGSGNPEITLYDSTSLLFMRINGKFWGTSDASGHKPDNGSVGWISNGVPAPKGFRVTHVPQNTLGAPAQSTGAAVAGGGYVNPFQKATGLVPERIDDGVDYAMDPGSPILAIGNVTVSQIINNWFQGQPLLLVQFLDGPNQGSFYYVAEQITGLPALGATVNAGATLCTYASSGTGIETGWGSATANSRTLAGQNGHGGQVPSPEGTSFSTFLKSLGAPGGT